MSSLVKTFEVVQLAETPAVIRRPSLWLGIIFGIAVIGLPISPWQQAASGLGKVVAFAPVDREQVIEAPVKGRIVEWFVVEGQHVKAGDKIVELADIDPNYVERLEANRDATLVRVQAAEEQSDAYLGQVRSLERAQQVTVEAARLRVTMAEQKLTAVRQTFEAEKTNFETAKLNVTRVEQLFTEGLSSKRDLELAELTFAKSKAEMNKAQAAVTEAESNVYAKQAELLQKGAEADAKVADAKAKAQKAQSDVAKAQEESTKIEVDLARQSSRIVTAPRDGTILRIMGSQGAKTVKVGAQLGILVPDTSS
ncbi:MAG: biotin/lipoyl-binding protein, partial [Myxococcota bacterium]